MRAHRQIDCGSFRADAHAAGLNHAVGRHYDLRLSGVGRADVHTRTRAGAHGIVRGRDANHVWRCAIFGGAAPAYAETLRALGSGARVADDDAV